MFALRERMRSDQLRYGQGWIYAQPQKPALYTYRRVWQIDDWINKCLSRPGDPMSPLVLQHGQHYRRRYTTYRRPQECTCDKV